MRAGYVSFGTLFYEPAKLKNLCFFLDIEAVLDV